MSVRAQWGMARRGKGRARKIPCIFIFPGARNLKTGRGRGRPGALTHGKKPQICEVLVQVVLSSIY